MTTKEQYLIQDLPEVIYANHRPQYLDVSGDEDEGYWTVSYAASTPWPNKKVFIHYEEPTLEMAVLKIYRWLALHRNEWELFTEENK